MTKTSYTKSPENYSIDISAVDDRDELNPTNVYVDFAIYRRGNLKTSFALSLIEAQKFAEYVLDEINKTHANLTNLIKAETYREIAAEFALPSGQLSRNLHLAALRFEEPET